ncbi:hypothetical protein [Sulfuricurvum sp.]|uniref:hypothetical protein n=1 Tax=Sulfuricurvum sp. TaxID=2025608 RepID=UPI0025FA03F0|nr:hypothetical protein [Sulfuricurvum sp.]
MFLLVGCSAPLSTLKPELTPSKAVPADKGHILISLFDVPKGYGELWTRFVFGMPRGINASVYDVTDGLTYLGSFGAGAVNGGNMIEYNAPLGKRTLMLTFQDFPKVFSLNHTDFIEVIATKDHSTHIALSQYGITQMPYFREMIIQEKDFNFCSNLTGKNETSEENIRKHMLSEKIDEKAKSFIPYCRSLSNDYRKILIPNTNALEMVEKYKLKINSMKETDLPKWQQNYIKSEPFDVLKVIETTAPENN